MISVDAARQLVTENVIPLSDVELSLANAPGKVLAQDIFAEADVPAFAQSAMDGYAFYFDDWKVHNALKIAGEIPAGTSTERSLNKDEAIRIFTGAPVPQGANTVVMQERTRVIDQGLFISDDRLMVGANVRPAGSEIKKGALAIQNSKEYTAYTCRNWLFGCHGSRPGKSIS
jgi:molybdopterin molybdotransferase